MEGRTAFAISDGTAIVGGGARRDENSIYTPVDGVWRLDADGQPSELPDLPADGVVFGLSGVKAAGTVVLGGQVCRAGIPMEFLSCFSPRQNAIWTLDPDAGDWVEQPIPAEVLDGAVTPDEIPTGLSAFRVVGAAGQLVVLGLGDGSRTRFVTFDPVDGNFAIVGEGAGNSGARSNPYCLDELGNIVQVREHLVPTGPSESGAEVLSVALLDSEGRWTEGPQVRFGDLGEGRTVRAGSIQCGPGHDPVVSVAVRSSTDVERILATFDLSSLTPSVWQPATSNIPDTSTMEFLQLRGVTSDGVLIVTMPTGAGNTAYYLTPEGEFVVIEGLVDASGSLFTYGDLVGTVEQNSGEIHVQQ